MTVLSVKEARALGDELQRDPIQHANHAVSLLNCIKDDIQEVSLGSRPSCSPSWHNSQQQQQHHHHHQQQWLTGDRKIFRRRMAPILP